MATRSIVRTGNSEVQVSEEISVKSIEIQDRIIQELMSRVMKEERGHFGVIPGTGKPTLFKAGAEKLARTFSMAAHFQVRETPLEGGHVKFLVLCKLRHRRNGIFLGSGVGSCSTRETKFRFRKADRVCPECGNAFIIKGKEEYGGGWLCFRKKGGCGAKFKDGDPRIEDQPSGKVENDPADFENTCLKMAKKRAFIDAVLTATAASDIFTQDIEDFQDSSKSAKKVLHLVQPGDDKENESLPSPSVNENRNQPGNSDKAAIHHEDDPRADSGASEAQIEELRRLLANPELKGKTASNGKGVRVVLTNSITKALNSRKLTRQTAEKIIAASRKALEDLDAAETRSQAV